MHSLETLQRMNTEWPNPLSHRDRKAAAFEGAIRNLESRLGAVIDRKELMIGAMAQLELALMPKCARRI